MRNAKLLFLSVLLVMNIIACAKKSEDAATSNPAASTSVAETLAAYPIEGMDGLITQSGVVFDSTTSADGNGSLKIAAEAPTTVRLFETGDVDVENASIIYSARLRTENVEGKVFLEMWCSFAGRGEFFSRALQAPLSGTVEWTSQETPFFLKPGENPDNVKLNVVIDGKGTVWIDEIRLVKGPLGDS